MPRLTHVDTLIAYGADPAYCDCRECVAWQKERGVMPKWDERMDQLEAELERRPTPIHDPKAATRATASQGMARPGWTLDTTRRSDRPNAQNYLGATPAHDCEVWEDRKIDVLRSHYGE